MDKNQLINLLKIITPLTDELNIIYEFYEDEYLYGILCKYNGNTIGIYDYLPDLSSLFLIDLTDEFYIKKIKVILASSYSKNDIKWNLYDKENNRWIILSFNQLVKSYHS